MRMVDCDKHGLNQSEANYGRCYYCVMAALKYSGATPEHLPCPDHPDHWLVFGQQKSPQ
jgi:hypothetical protein